MLNMFKVDYKDTKTNFEHIQHAKLVLYCQPSTCISLPWKGIDNQSLEYKLKDRKMRIATWFRVSTVFKFTVMQKSNKKSENIQKQLFGGVL